MTTQSVRVRAGRHAQFLALPEPSGAKPAHSGGLGPVLLYTPPGYSVCTSATTVPLANAIGESMNSSPACAKNRGDHIGLVSVDSSA